MIGSYREKLSKMPPTMASGRIFREWLEEGSPNFTHLSGVIGLANVQDATSPTTSGRLQNATNYITKVCEMDSAGQIVE